MATGSNFEAAPQLGWLKAEFARAKARSDEVPEWARPKVLHKPTTPIPGDGHST